MSDKPWTKQTLSEMRIFAAAQDPPIDLGTATRKADVHAIITKAMAERAVQPLVEAVERQGECEVCGVRHSCNRCNGPRGTDMRAHDEPLCERCASLGAISGATNPDAVRADGLDTDDIMAAFRDGRSIDADHEDILEVQREQVASTSLARMPSAGRWAQMQDMSVKLQASTLVRNPRPEDVLVLLLAAHDLGISSTMALQQIHVIDGKPSLSSQLMVALVRNAGYSILPVEMTATTATARGVRGREEAEFTFTIEDAQAAGLAGKDNWAHYPKAMLWARAVSGLCRILFPDVLAGLAYTPEELGADVDSEGRVIDAQSWEAGAAPVAASHDAAEDLLYPKCEHDGSGVCCRFAIKERIDALSAPVKAIMQEDWNAAREADELPPFRELRAKHQAKVKSILDAAETQETQLAQTLLRTTLGAVDTAAGDELERMVEQMAEPERTVDRETGEVVMSRSESELAERAREIAREASSRDAQTSGLCVVCGKALPLDEMGYCAGDRPF